MSKSSRVEKVKEAGKEENQYQQSNVFQKCLAVIFEVHEATKDLVNLSLSLSSIYVVCHLKRIRVHILYMKNIVSKDY